MVFIKYQMFWLERKPEQAYSDMHTSDALIAKKSKKLKESGSDSSRAFLQLLYNKGFYRYNQCKDQVEPFLMFIEDIIFLTIVRDLVEIQLVSSGYQTWVFPIGWTS